MKTMNVEEVCRNDALWKIASLSMGWQYINKQTKNSLKKKVCTIFTRPDIVSAFYRNRVEGENGTNSSVVCNKIKECERG